MRRVEVTSGENEGKQGWFHEFNGEYHARIEIERGWLVSCLVDHFRFLDPPSEVDPVADAIRDVGVGIVNAIEKSSVMGESNITTQPHIYDAIKVVADSLDRIPQTFALVAEDAMKCFKTGEWPR